MTWCCSVHLHRFVITNMEDEIYFFCCVVDWNQQVFIWCNLLCSWIGPCLIRRREDVRLKDCRLSGNRGQKSWARRNGRLARYRRRSGWGNESIGCLTILIVHYLRQLGAIHRALQAVFICNSWNTNRSRRLRLDTAQIELIKTGLWTYSNIDIGGLSTIQSPLQGQNRLTRCCLDHVKFEN